METVPALGVKKNQTFSRKIEKLRIGQFQLGMCADDENKANELNEANNCSPAPLKIAVVPAPAEPGKPPPAPATPTGKPWDGWIKMSGKTDGGESYGVRYDPDTTRFCGYAWGGNVVGWVKFGPLPEEIPLRPDEDKQARAGWICDQTRTVDAKGIISAPPYRVIPGSAEGDWVRLADTAFARIEVDENKITSIPISPYDDTIVDQLYTLTGWAWSSNIGWISMSSTTVPQGGVDYGVRMRVGKVTVEGANRKENPSERNLIGYAWSSNIGWVKFDARPFGEENYPESPSDPAYLDISQNILKGWARVCSATVGGDCNSLTGEYREQ